MRVWPPRPDLPSAFDSLTLVIAGGALGLVAAGTLALIGWRLLRWHEQRTIQKWIRSRASSANPLDRKQNS